MNTVAETPVTPSAKTETKSVDEVGKPAPIDTATETPPPAAPAPARKKVKPKAVIPKKSAPAENAEATEYIRRIPAGVMNAMRAVFPCKLTGPDLISAFVYVHTDGNCGEISDAAKDAARLYQGKKAEFNIAAEILKINKKMAQQNEKLNTIEIGAAALLADKLAWRVFQVMENPHH